MYVRKWLVVALVFFVVSVAVHAQQPKNVQLLTGLSRPEVQRVMNEMRAGLGTGARPFAGSWAAIRNLPIRLRWYQMEPVDAGQAFRDLVCPQRGEDYLRLS